MSGYVTQIFDSGISRKAGMPAAQTLADTGMPSRSFNSFLSDREGDKIGSAGNEASPVTKQPDIDEDEDLQPDRCDGMSAQTEEASEPTSFKIQDEGERPNNGFRHDGESDIFASVTGSKDVSYERDEASAIPAEEVILDDHHGSTRGAASAAQSLLLTPATSADRPAVGGVAKASLELALTRQTGPRPEGQSMQLNASDQVDGGAISAGIVSRQAEILPNQSDPTSGVEIRRSGMMALMGGEGVAPQAMLAAPAVSAETTAKAAPLNGKSDPAAPGSPVAAFPLLSFDSEIVPKSAQEEASQPLTSAATWASPHTVGAPLSPATITPFSAVALSSKAWTSGALVSTAGIEDDALTTSSSTGGLPTSDIRLMASSGAELRSAIAVTEANSQTGRAVIAQVADAVTKSAERAIDVILNPVELGRVRITLSPGDAGLMVHVMAERGETLDLMRRHSDLLGQEFQDLGYGGADFSFSGDQKSSQDAEESSPARLHMVEDSIASPASLSADNPLKIGALDRIDIRL